MLFSNPDYPIFLVAVFFLYALSRYGNGTLGWIARACVMVLLGDVAFVLVAKDPGALGDPLGAPGSGLDQGIYTFQAGRRVEVTLVGKLGG